jgi:glycosyltransferase involved in cell wall biosynthesis
LKVPARAARSAWRTLGRPHIDGLIGSADVVHATNFVLPPVRDAATAVTVHDLSFLHNDVFPGGQALRKLTPWSIGRADVVITPSEAVAGEVTDRYGAGVRIAVTPEGVSPVFFGATRLADSALGSMGIPGPFILAVGTLEPRKNLGTLVAAWQRIRAALPGWSLVLAGPSGWGPEIPRTEGVILTGWIGDETLPGLLAAAELFCFPSLYEGFGLPPLEAMAAGVPCVAGSYSAAQEVLGDAAVLIEATDVTAWSDTLVSLARDATARRALAMAARTRAATFTWERCGKATISAYRAILSG